MAKTLKLHLKVDAQTGKITQVSDEFVTFHNRVKQTGEGVSDLKTKLLKIGAALGGVYLIKKAFDVAADAMGSFSETSSQFEQYENRMSAFTNSVEEQKSELIRARNFALEYRQAIDKTTETLLLMKNYGLKDTNEQLKIYANTALGAGKSVEQFAEAMADALTGENERLKEFGIKASQQGQKVAYTWTDSSGQARNIIIQNNKDVIDSTLTAIFNEKYVGQLEKYKNSWAGIGQGMKNTWTQFKLQVADEGLLAYFKNLGENFSQYVGAGFKDGTVSAKQFADDTISFINAIIKGIGFLVKALSGFANLMRTVYAGYLKLDGFIGGGLNEMAVNNSKDKIKELERILKEKDFGAFSNQNQHITEINLVKEKKALAEYTKEQNKYNDIRKEGDALLEKTEKSQENINQLIEDAISLSTKAASSTGSTQSEIDKVNEKIKKEQEELRKQLLGMGAGFGSSAQDDEKAAKAAAKAAEKYAKEFAKARDRLAEARLSDEEKQLKKLGDDLNDLGQYLTQAELSEIYESEINKMKKETKSLGEVLEQTFQDAFDAILHGDFKAGFTSLIKGSIDTMTIGVSDSISGGLSAFIDGKGISGFTSAFSGLSIGNWIAAAASLLGGLFSSTVSQAQIDAATGRSDWSDESIRNLTDAFENAQYPMLEVTYKMSKYLRSMESNFGRVALAITGKTSTAGVDLTGVNFSDTYKEGFLGFSSKSVSLLGTGLAFELQTLAEMMNEAELSVRGYTSTLVQESSWWGLSSDTYTKTTFKNLPKGVVQDIASSFAYGFEAIMTAGVSLGLEESNLREALENAKINIGKVDFTGLSPDEVSQRLSEVMSEALSGVVMGVEDFSILVNRYAKSSEYALETLGRLALEFDQASFQFGLIGKDFTNGGLIDVTKTVEVELTRTLDRWGNVVENGVEYSTGQWGELFNQANIETNTLLRQFFSTTTETYTEMMDVIVKETYTAQMQILDIVESAGGLQSFNDAMTAFMTNFYTDAEQVDFITKSVQASFNTLGISMPKTNAEFRTLLETMDTSTEEGAYLYGQVLLLSESFAQMSHATEQLSSSVSASIKEIADAWLGNLSYLTLQQKAEYASGYLKIASSSQGAIDTAEAARAAAEIALKTSATKDEYIPYFERYIAELSKQEEDATNRDLLNEIKELKQEVINLQEVTIEAAINSGTGTNG
ncbi:hypothetical protein PGH07_07785 [Sulfurovum sp. zt1-1]|uniref:Uncharacterized protein n=1 Tax=Sulfurovum zhangzhouensis TaxID=3019067 RepID=A0ABT7QZ61_9BACT|nr:hypothetical protein [Sulfurovum zhangzhouensis]MDM5272077.1 hypothetical protein [Sulfurovum zhangzhouensis]